MYLLAHVTSVVARSPQEWREKYRAEFFSSLARISPLIEELQNGQGHIVWGLSSRKCLDIGLALHNQLKTF